MTWYFTAGTSKPNAVSANFVLDRNIMREIRFLDHRGDDMGTRAGRTGADFLHISVLFFAAAGG